MPNPQYDKISAPITYTTRAQADVPCNCTICLLMRDTLRPGKAYSKQKTLPTPFQTLLFPDEVVNISTSGNKPQVESRCVDCGSVVGKGRTHKCNKSTKRENVLGLVRQMSLKSKERTARDALINIFEDKGVKRSPKSGTNTTLNTGGRKVSITYGGLGSKGGIRKGKWTKESMMRLQTSMNLSDNGIK